MLKRTLLIIVAMLSLSSCSLDSTKDSTKSTSNSISEKDLSENSTSQKDTRNLREIIESLYYPYLMESIELYDSDYSSEQIEQSCRVDLYVGHKDDVYAITFDCSIRDRWLGGRVYCIRIGEYESKMCYYQFGYPVIFYQNALYNLNNSLSKGIIDLDFIKTFDEFQLEHTAEELEDIYL